MSTFNYKGIDIDLDIGHNTPMFYYKGIVEDYTDLSKIEEKTTGDLYTTADAREMYVYINNSWETVSLVNQYDHDISPKIRVRNNCCNCNAILPAGDIVRCEYCGTVQDTRKEVEV